MAARMMLVARAWYQGRGAWRRVAVPLLQAHRIGIAGRSLAGTANATDQGLGQQHTDSDSEFSGEEEGMADKNKILKAALPFVHNFGWSVEAICSGARAAGYPSTAHGLFPAGGVELVHYFYQECNEELVRNMKQWIQEEEKNSTKQGSQKAFLQDALWFRLQLNVPYIDKWAQGMGLMALPQNATSSWKLPAQLMDDVWFHAGDRATEFDWYTKRVGLAVIYSSAELFQLQDTSEGFRSTLKFLERRMNDAQNLNKASKQLKSGSSSIPENLNYMYTTLRNMIGANPPR